jgi:cbb3-type cytochrome oxidase maturation protein
MSVIIVLMLASLAVGLIFVGAFVWSVRSGQYEDTLTPSLRVLADEDFKRAGDESVPFPAPQPKNQSGNFHNT